MSEFKQRLIEYGVDVDPTFERFINDEEFYKVCFRMLLNDENFELLGNSISENDAKAAFEAAHALKGVIVNLGLTSLETPIDQIVKQLRDNATSTLDESYRELMEELEKAKNLL